ncbi:MAG: hypothetical protein KBD78_09345 [Oligoflexales bacterium]|nr:hypothetical protein [Oligoflexales bacterium]
MEKTQQEKNIHRVFRIIRKDSVENSPIEISSVGKGAEKIAESIKLRKEEVLEAQGNFDIEKILDLLS